MIELRGKKVVLRTLERAHCRTLWEQYEPQQPIPTEPLNPGLSVEGADKWFDEMQARQGREQVYLGVFTQAGELIGDIQLANVDWRNRSASLGLGIANQSQRGRGYGADAALVMLHYGFEQLDLCRISAATLEFNMAAQHVLAKCGFQQEGCERQAVFCAGRRWNRLTYGLLRPDFAALFAPQGA
jgi:RimJ/RimL family protein N-acetyltransferase